tara:strand:+ start:356 stop:928 length:573 start_codon:yes stop_codon:yes gene_type:complete
MANVVTHFRQKGLKNSKIEKEFTRFAKGVIKQAKINLKREKKIFKGKLLKSLKYKLTVQSTGTTHIIFRAAPYADFVDKGVKGAKSTARAPKSPYAYTNKRPPVAVFSQWVIKKGLKGTRDSKGRFTSRKSMQYAIAESIYKKGMAPTPFFTKAFKRQFALLDRQIVEAFKLDVETLLTDALTKETKNNK